MQQSPWVWAAECYELATNPAVGYSVRAASDGPCAYAPGNLTLDESEPERTLEIDEAYVERMGTEGEESLLYASVHLTNLIEDAVGQLR